MTPRLIPIVHADDCGLTPGMTDGIVACHDRGVLRRVSVIVNGSGWEHAVDVLRQRPHLGVVLHINMFEGAPLSAPSDVDLLVDRHGRFNRSFGSLWAHGYGPAGARLRSQIRAELIRQLDRFVGAFGDRGDVSVDGHVHYHLLPPVIDALMTLCKDYRIRAIRLPRERFHWAPTWSTRPPLLNVAKHAVLRLLSSRALLRLRAHGLQTTAAFIGVLGTGHMTFDAVRAALTRLRAAGVTGDVEILFHPGRAGADEAAAWADRPQLGKYYASTNRDREAELLCSPRFASLLQEFTRIPADGRGRRKGEARA